ncbi:MAG: KTSC domain-containing protein [Sphingobacteriales bacterium]|nr:MAG: KTSC domain-containing protein [Sphingobacteriales bacterium]
MSKIERVPVDSSMIYAVGYDAESQTLYAEFNSGKIYAYEEVEPDVFEELLESDSKGRFMRNCIIGCYPDYQVSRGKGGFKW